MATPPTRVSYNTPASGNFSTAVASFTTAAFNVTAGDLVVVLCSIENGSTPTTVTPSASGGSITWTSRASQVPSANQSAAYCWTGVVGATATGITVTLNRPSTTSTLWWGMSATVYRSHGGVGVAFSGNNGTATNSAPSVSATCSANSAVVCQINDWNAASGTSRTWRTINGSPETETVYFTNASHHTVYGGFRADTGAAGSITQGLTAPTGQRWVLAGVEILGTSGSAATGTLSAGVPRVTSSIAGTTTAPVATGTLGASVPRPTASIAGTVTPPTTGTLSAAVPLATGSAAGMVAGPVYAGTLSVSTPPVTGSLAGSTSVPSSTGSIAASTPLPTSSAAGSVTPPTYGGTVSASTPKTMSSITGTATPPTYSGTLSAPIPPTRSTIAGTVTNPAGAATLSASVPRVIGSLSGTVAPPTWAGTLNGQFARLTASTTGIVTAPVFTGTLDGTTPRPTAVVVGTITAPSGSGTLLAALPSLAGSLTGVVTLGPPTEFEGRILSVRLSIPTASGSIAAMSASGDLEAHEASGRLSILHAKGALS